MQHREVLNHDFHIGSILASTVKPLDYSQELIQFP